MNTATTFQDWIDKGYEVFSRSGPDGIKVQSLARKLGLSKSSFYHHFGDQESFISLLLEEHAHIMEECTAEVKSCKKFDPDFIDLIIKYKTSILFQQQLRNHRDNPEFNQTWKGITQSIADQVVDLWARYMDISSDMNAARSLFLLIEDVFYERVSKDTFNAAWIYGMLDEVKSICKRMVEAKTSGKPFSNIVR